MAMRAKPELTVTDLPQNIPATAIPPASTPPLIFRTTRRTCTSCSSVKMRPVRCARHLSKREDLDQDDGVGVFPGHFHDKHRAYYYFFETPLGIQQDAIYTEVRLRLSFDTVWNSEGRLTQDGYVVWFAIPFKSLRFFA